MVSLDFLSVFQRSVAAELVRPVLERLSVSIAEEVRQTASDSMAGIWRERLVRESVLT